MSSKDNTADANIPDINIPIWFDLHIVTKLQMIGKCFCVEDLKLFKPLHIEALFGDEDYIVMLRDELAWEDLDGRDQYIFKNSNPNLSNLTETKYLGVFKVFTINISPKKILPPAYLFRIVGRGGEII